VIVALSCEYVALTCTFLSAAAMQARISQEKAARLSVRLSVKRHVHCDKTTKSCAHILIPHEKSFFLFSEKNGWWGAAYLKFWVKLIPLERKSQFSVDIRL